ncbi:inositol monophosphatase family protein [Aureimonas leprariae]|uniref:Inositol monophosphatase n=1 Tax=Plantimonas leprariae TaxID=2615207 RepID=A0A7V7PMZ9_9HYPH|nr:inositol monophosphatase [Aureimonas leprariae]KAB0678554.1 inositol monophosphatase [Aureimonas leprariae]
MAENASTDRAGIARRYEFGLALVREAGELALGYFRRREMLTIQSKGLQDMASEADLETERLIRRRLAEAFPDDAFLGEETGVSDHRPGQGIWVVDPIDGTQPFISGLSSWCVSIAFVADDEVQFGTVFAPARGELFAGGIDVPATLNGRPMERHPGRSVRDGITATGHAPRVPPERFLPAFERLLKAGGMFYRDGSGALMLCDVACGRLLGYMEQHIHAWDCLGAVAVVRAAGLRTNDFLAGDGLRKGNPIVAGNESVFRELEAIMRG